MINTLSQATVAPVYNPSYLGGTDREDLWFKASLGKWFWETLSQKNQNKYKKELVVDGSSSKSTCLASVEAQSSNPSTKKKKKKIQKELPAFLFFLGGGSGVRGSNPGLNAC
jgi:hypothetical protein